MSREVIVMFILITYHADSAGPPPIPFGPPSHLGPVLRPIPIGPVLFGPILFGPMVVSDFTLSMMRPLFIKYI